LLLGLLLILALLSKPMPGLLFAAGAAWAALAGPDGRMTIAGSAWAAMAAGALATVAGAAALVVALEIPPDALGLSLLTLPGETGAARLAPDFLAARLSALAKIGPIALALALVFCWRRFLTDLHLAATTILVAGAAYALLSDNSAWFGLGALPAAAGLAHLLVEKTLHHQPGLRGRLGWTLAALTATQALVLHLDITMTRAANELRRAHWAVAPDAGAIDPRLAGLRFALPPMVARDLKAEDRAAVYRRLLDLLRAREGGFVLVGDATILYALAGRAAPLPALWLHPGLTYPRPGHRDRPLYDAMLARGLAREGVRTVVLDGERSWTGATLAELAPGLARCLEGEAGEAVGRFRVFALPPGCIQR